LASGALPLDGSRSPLFPHRIEIGTPRDEAAADRCGSQRQPDVDLREIL
jgi:hypothetical protein